MPLSSLQILFSDGPLFAVLKPSLTHSVRNTRTGNESIADRLLREDPTLADAARQSGDAGLLNRLDYETSGVLFGARTREAWEQLFAVSKADGITKEYLAVLSGRLTRPRLIDAWIGQAGRRSLKVRASFERPRDKYRAEIMRTNFVPLSSSLESDCSLAHVTITRGHRHQIRAHAALMGHPLKGDTLYDGVETPSAGPPFLLHAWKISFIFNGCPIHIEAPLPDYFPRVDQSTSSLSG